MVALQILILSVGVRIPIPLPMESYPSWAWHGLENRWTAKAVRVRFYYPSSILKHWVRYPQHGAWSGQDASIWKVGRVVMQRIANPSSEKFGA